VYTVDTPRGRAVGSGTCPSGSADRHAERRAWEQAKNHVRNTIGRGGIITITFEIDTIVCRDCVRWFENTVYSEIQGYIQDAARSGKNAQVQVFVSVNDNRTQLLGAVTNWTNVGNPDIEVPDPVSVKQMAKEKLEKEMKADKDKTFAEPVIGYLLKRCEDDLGLAQDVVQEHKTWKKCLDYIYGQARKQATENRAVVRNDVVYEWAEDYYHKDDKAEEEKKAKKEAERKAKQKKAAEERKAKAKENSAKAAPTPQKKEDMPKEQPKSKRNGKDMDGQLDMFFMMGM